MFEILPYDQSMQAEIEEFFKKCFSDLGWEYEPEGRHADIVNIPDTYMKSGTMWCLFFDGILAGTVAVRTIDIEGKTAEMKRLYVLKDYQGQGYGGLLFETAIAYCCLKGYNKICLDTRNDRAASLHLINKYGFKPREKYNDNDFAEQFFEIEL